MLSKKLIGVTLMALILLISGCGNSKTRSTASSSSSVLAVSTTVTSTTIGSTTALPSPLVLTARGLGALQIGYTVAQVKASAKETVTTGPSGGDATQVCSLNLASLSQVAAYVNNSKVIAVEVHNPQYTTTAAGVHVGTSISALNTAYPTATRKPSQNIPAVNFVVNDRDSGNEYVFETDGQVVTDMLVEVAGTYQDEQEFCG